MKKSFEWPIASVCMYSYLKLYTYRINHQVLKTKHWRDTGLPADIFIEYWSVSILSSPEITPGFSNSKRDP